MINYITLVLITFSLLFTGCKDDKSLTTYPDKKEWDKDNWEIYPDAITTTFDGQIRYYYVYVPNSYTSNTNVPLMFNLHGGSGDIGSQLAISDMRPLAESNEFILVYPQALPDPSDGGATSWIHKSPTTMDDTLFIEALINILATNYLIDERRVYACGYSLGGEFSFELACSLSSKIAAIGVVARSMQVDTYNSCSPSHPTPVLTIHGTLDYYDGLIWEDVLYYTSLDDVNKYWSEYNNTITNPTIIQVPDSYPADGSIVEHHIYSSGDNGTSVEHFKVVGGGHDWPGSFGNMDIDATKEIWDFVSRYDINGLR